MINSNKISLFIVTLVLGFSLYGGDLHGDGGSEFLARDLMPQEAAKEVDPGTTSETAQDRALHNNSTEKQLDPRLPPTIPGQEMVVGGKKVKVTTTAGSVAVENAPEPFHKERDEMTKEILKGGVIVDDRNVNRNSNRPR